LRLRGQTFAGVASRQIVSDLKNVKLKIDHNQKV